MLLRETATLLREGVCKDKRQRRARDALRGASGQLPPPLLAVDGGMRTLENPFPYRGSEASLVVRAGQTISRAAL